MSVAPKTGHDLKLYYNTGTYQSETLVLIDQVTDVNIADLAYQVAELKRRASRWTLKQATSLTAALEFTILHAMSPTVFSALRTAFFNRTVTEFWILNGSSATAGTQGLRMHCLITQFPWDQPLEEISSHSVRAEPSYKYDDTEEAELLPEWVTISA